MELPLVQQYICIQTSNFDVRPARPFIFGWSIRIKGCKAITQHSFNDPTASVLRYIIDRNRDIGVQMSFPLHPCNAWNQMHGL